MATNIHSAPGQMLGYLFQIDRALFWLSLPQVDCVSIETEDDVVATIGDVRNFEQDKSTIAGRNPFSNHSVDLWKSIRNWLELISLKSIDTKKAKFFLVTNKEIKSKCLVLEIVGAKSDSDYESCHQQFLIIAEKASSNLKPIISDILENYSKNDLISLFKSMDLFHGKDLKKRSDFKEALRKNLPLNKDFPFNVMYDRLYGWITNELFEKWQNKEEAYFTREQFNTLASDLISEYNSKPFIELTKECIPIMVDSELEKQHSTAMFIKQLEIISADEDDRVKAINDFLRAAWQRTQDAEEGRVTDYYSRFEDDLKVKWKNSFKRHTKFLNTSDRGRLIEVGYQLYLELIDVKEKIGEYETTQFHTTNGTYHRLANNLNIGWHPNWQEIIKNDGE